jgi:hypothetical protein
MKKETYIVTSIFWVPSYRDFDQDDFTVEATSLEDARVQAVKHPYYKFAKYEPHIALAENQSSC